MLAEKNNTLLVETPGGLIDHVPHWQVLRWSEFYQVKNDLIEQERERIRDESSSSGYGRSNTSSLKRLLKMPAKEPSPSEIWGSVVNSGPPLEQ